MYLCEAVHSICTSTHKIQYGTQAWAPWREGDKLVLEKVHKKAVGLVTGMAGREYEERLKELGLQTLEEQRHQADMCMMHKIMHGIGGLNHKTWFKKASDSARLTRL